MSGIVGGTGSKSGVLGQTGSGWIKLWRKEITSDSGADTLNIPDDVTAAGTVFTNKFDRYMITVSHFSTIGQTDAKFNQIIDGSVISASVRRTVYYMYSDSGSVAVNNSNGAAHVPFTQGIGDDQGKGCDVTFWGDLPWAGREKRIWFRSCGYTGIENRLSGLEGDMGSNNTGVLTGIRLTADNNIDHCLATIYGLSKH